MLHTHRPTVASRPTGRAGDARRRSEGRRSAKSALPVRLRLRKTAAAMPEGRRTRIAPDAVRNASPRGPRGRSQVPAHNGIHALPHSQSSPAGRPPNIITTTPSCAHPTARTHAHTHHSFPWREGAHTSWHHPVQRSHAQHTELSRHSQTYECHRASSNCASSDRASSDRASSDRASSDRCAVNSLIQQPRRPIGRVSPSGGHHPRGWKPPSSEP